MFYLQLLVTWSVFVIVSSSTMSATIETTSAKETPEIIASQTYIILYDNAINEQSSINCSFPLINMDILQLWTVPSGVQLKTAQENGTRNPAEENKKFPEVWVELTADNTLVFHNPDNSLSGPYTCRTISNDKQVFQTTVWVHVLNKSFFDVKKRLKTALITSSIFFIITLCFYVCYWHKNKKSDYSLTEQNDDFMNIPKIQVTCASQTSLYSAGANSEKS